MVGKRESKLCQSVMCAQNYVSYIPVGSVGQTTALCCVRLGILSNNVTIIFYFQCLR